MEIQLRLGMVTVQVKFPRKAFTKLFCASSASGYRVAIYCALLRAEAFHRYKFDYVGKGVIMASEKRNGARMRSENTLSPTAESTVGV